MNDEKTTRPKRRRFLTNLSFQGHLTVYFVILLVLGELVAGASFYFLANREMTSQFYRAHAQIRSIWEILLPAVVVTMLVTVVVIVTSSAILMLWYSNRIAGPLQRIIRVVQAMADGDVSTEIKIRSEDQIVSLAKALNHHTAYLSEQLEELGVILADLDGVLDSSEREGDSHVWQILDSCRHRLRDVVHRFKGRNVSA